MSKTTPFWFFFFLVIKRNWKNCYLKKKKKSWRKGNSVCLGRTEQREHEERKRTHVLDRFLDARDCEGVNNVRVLHLRYLVTDYQRIGLRQPYRLNFFTHFCQNLRMQVEESHDLEERWSGSILSSEKKVEEVASKMASFCSFNEDT